MFKIDGNEFNVFVTDLQRSFQVLDGENAGRALDGSMTRDIVGTYYNYTMQIDGSRMTREEYDTLYEILSSPSDSHKIVVPYGQTTLTFNAYVTAGTDKLRMMNGHNYWSGLSIQFIAMDAQRQ